MWVNLNEFVLINSRFILARKILDNIIKTGTTEDDFNIMPLDDIIRNPHLPIKSIAAGRTTIPSPLLKAPPSALLPIPSTSAAASAASLIEADGTPTIIHKSRKRKRRIKLVQLRMISVSASLSFFLS